MNECVDQRYHVGISVDPDHRILSAVPRDGTKRHIRSKDQKRISSMPPLPLCTGNQHAVNILAPWHALVYQITIHNFLYHSENHHIIMADDKKIKAVKKEGGKKAQDLAYVDERVFFMLLCILHILMYSVVCVQRSVCIGRRVLFQCGGRRARG